MMIRARLIYGLIYKFREFLMVLTYNGMEWYQIAYCLMKFGQSEQLHDLAVSLQGYQKSK